LTHGQTGDDQVLRALVEEIDDDSDEGQCQQDADAGLRGGRAFRV
jgi:hypothetical protein